MGKIIFVLLLLIRTSFFAEETSGLLLSGSLYQDMMVHHYYNDNTNEHRFKYAGNSTLELGFINRDRDFAKIEGDIQISLLTGEYRDLFMLKMGVFSNLIILNNTALLLNLRKLYLQLYTPIADITIGRQIVKFGEGYLFSPIDVFSSVNISDIRFSRSGSDILWLKFPLGDTGGLDLISSVSSDLTNFTPAVKLLGSVLDTDIGIISIYKPVKNELTTGVTLKGNLLLGFHAEFVEHFTKNYASRFFEGMVGLDYSFFDGSLVLLAEYYYNEKIIKTNNLNYLNLSSIDRPFYNRHYLFFQAQWIPDEISTAGVNMILNPLDSSFILTGLYQYSLFQSADLMIYCRYFQNQINGLDFLKAYILEYAARMEVKF